MMGVQILPFFSGKTPVDFSRVAVGASVALRCNDYCAYSRSYRRLLGSHCDQMTSGYEAIGQDRSASICRNRNTYGGGQAQE
jgi:hypothetical protein